MTIQSNAYSASSATSPLVPVVIERREPKENDVLIDIQFCGICHSDLHSARNEWGHSIYPLVPGHEIVGTVKSVGTGVTKYKAGDIVGVGCMVDSCRNCGNCLDDFQQHCAKSVMTYNTKLEDGSHTLGGYSQQVTVDQDFVLRIPEKFHKKIDQTAPLLCAGITTFSPLKRFGVTKGTRVGIVGLGGLGHVGVKIAKAMGAEVTVLSHSPHKEQKAKEIGADNFVVTSNEEQLNGVRGNLDLILDTVSAKHGYDLYLSLLRLNGTMVLLGAPPSSEISAFTFLFGRKNLTGSLIGGIEETQEMLDFCAEHDILADIKLIKASEINDAFETLTKGDFPQRFVIDSSSLSK
mmetsp:Transcript_6347/g.23908  ORF Transcript_6347/g.23908 Transcript_6347/m.23908 type:complete len:350 (+) Transcript_6347:3525-4574(+)